MKRLLFLIPVLLFLLPVSAGMKVQFQPGLDFGNFQTYAWKAGTEASSAQAQRWIMLAVERELKADGFTKKSGTMPDVYIVTHVSADIESRLGVNIEHYSGYGAWLTLDSSISADGVLMVQILDAETEQAVWVGSVSALMNEPTLKQLQKKINRVTKKMFKGFPPN